MTGTAVVPSTLAEIRELRASGSNDYWKPEVQSAELAMVEAEQRPQAKALASIERLKSEVGDWSTLFATFDSLPETVHTAVASELMRDPPIWPPAVSWQECQAFKRTEVGRLCAGMWGEKLPEKLAIVRARLWRIVDELSVDDAVPFRDWIDESEAHEGAGAMKMLAGA